jgi:hypothetical protein
MPKRTSIRAIVDADKKREAEGSDIPQSGNTAILQDTVKPQSSKAAQSGKTPKITIYPTQEQVNKLYDLMEAYRQKTGFKINQQDMIRRLIDLAQEDTVLP